MVFDVVNLPDAGKFDCLIRLDCYENRPMVKQSSSRIHMHCLYGNGMAVIVVIWI